MDQTGRDRVLDVMVAKDVEGWVWDPSELDPSFTWRVSGGVRAHDVLPYSGPDCSYIIKLIDKKFISVNQWSLRITRRGGSYVVLFYGMDDVRINASVDEQLSVALCKLVLDAVKVR